jgi:hypothetical protein
MDLHPRASKRRTQPWPFSRDVTPRQPESESEMVASNINAVLERATGTSVQEIDKLITELQTLRDTLQSEAARVQREIVEYATLTQGALQSTKIIAESLKKVSGARPETAD